MQPNGNSRPLKLEAVSSATSSENWKFCFWLVIASLALNMLAVWLLRRYETIGILESDERGYWNLAGAFLDFGVSAIHPERTPPFPILIATLRSLFGSEYLKVQFALSAILSISPVLVFWLVRRQLGDERAARFASIGFLLWPLFVRYGSTLYADSTALTAFLIYLLSFPLISDQQNPGIRRWVQFCVSGVLLSVCMQLKPMYLIYIPFAVMMAISRESTLRRRLYAAGFLVAGCIIITLPWSTYISLREGHVIPLSANDGETLAGGLNPKRMKLNNQYHVAPDGRLVWDGAGKWLPPRSTGYLSKQDLELPFTEQSRLLKARAFEWISSHPKAVAYLSARKLLYMWGIYPFWNGATQTLLGNVPLLLLIGAALLSLWINRDALLNLALFWTLPLFSSAVSLVSWGSWRFRLPGDLGLIVLAAMLLANWRPLIRILRNARQCGAK